MIRVFDGARDLLDDVDPATADTLRRRTTVRATTVDPGPWDPASAGADPAGTFGLLVADGLLIRELLIDGRAAPELIGAGDVVQPWASDVDEQSSIAGGIRWSALATPARTHAASFSDSSGVSESGRGMGADRARGNPVPDA